MSGRATFLAALILVLVFCFVDAVVPGGKLIPTYTKHIVVSCLIYAILTLGLDSWPVMWGRCPWDMRRSSGWVLTSPVLCPYFSA